MGGLESTRSSPALAGGTSGEISLLRTGAKVVILLVKLPLPVTSNIGNIGFAIFSQRHSSHDHKNIKLQIGTEYRQDKSYSANSACMCLEGKDNEHCFNSLMPIYFMNSIILSQYQTSILRNVLVQ
jgi:hypothetical protein